MPGKFSRMLPEYVPPNISSRGWVALFILLAWLLTVLVSFPLLFLWLPVLFIVAAGIGKFQARKLENLRQRNDDSICTFARSLNFKEIDSWIIRAVYEEVQNAVNPAVRLPIRPSDLLVEDLSIDPEDLDEIAEIIAQRAGYSVNDPEKNPYYGKVRTVEDLILFFTRQVKIRID